MNRPQDPEDIEIRRLLDSLEIIEETDSPPLDSPTRERAEALLRHITSQPVDPPKPAATSAVRRWRTWFSDRMLVRLTVTTTALASLVLAIIVIDPFTGSQPAMARTPPMLPFSNAPAGHLPAATSSAREVLTNLAATARNLPDPAAGPVQHVELDAWWSSSSEPTEGEDAETVLIPVQVNSYLLPSNELRSIEHRGQPLEKDGRISKTPADWDDAEPVSDTIVSLEETRGADYVESLPTEPREIVNALAPEADCANRVGECLLDAISDVYRTYVVSPQAVASMWEALALEPSIKYLGRTTDRLGRNAVAFTAVTPGSTQQTLVLADPSTGRFLGVEHVLIATDPSVGFDPPAVLDFTAVIRSERIEADAMPDDTSAQRF